MSTRGLIVALFSFAACGVCTNAVTQTAATQLTIDYPLSNSTVPKESIEVSGKGADPQGTLQVEVVTDASYKQVGKTQIAQDGTWSFSPCYLKGEREYNNHTIRVTLFKNGKAVTSVSVRGVQRRSPP